MNEIQLSDSLPVIETEIRQYQNLAGESIFEIGRRLKHVKENDLAHGEFSSWCERIGFQREYANKHIKVFEEFDGSTSTQLGLSALYEISTLPEPERTKEHVTEKGETKTPDEMTVRELRELKKRLKNQSETIDETTSQLKAREKENEILQSKLEQAENKAPEIVERYTEPEDYEELKENIRRMKRQEKSLSENNKRLMEEISDMRNERSDMDVKSKKYEELTQAINEMDNRLTEGQVRIKNQKLVYDLVQRSEALIKEVAPLVYAVDHLDVEDNEYAKKPLLKIAKSLDDITKKIYKQLNENQIIEVE